MQSFNPMPRLPRRPDTPQSEEILPIVDENDIEVGSASRAEIHRKAWRHRAVHIVVLSAEGEVLLQRRSLLKDTYPGYWDISVGGHVGVHESYEEAARRELREELGVEAPLRLVTKLKAAPLTNWEFIEVYETRHEGPFFPPPEEITDTLWMAPDAIFEKAALDRSWRLTRSALHTLRAWHERNG